MTILSAKEGSFASLRFKGSESTKKDQITENTVAWRLKNTKKYGITLVLEKYCNNIRNRWQEGRCFVSKQYSVFKPPYESCMTAISILVFHESWYTKPFSDGFWDIETPVKKCFWEYWGRGKGKSLLYQDIKAWKKCLDEYFPNVLKEICVIFFFSLSKYDNLEWDFRGHHQSFLPQTSAALVILFWEIRAWKGKRIVFTQRHEFFLVVRWSIVRMVLYIRTPIKIFLNIHFEFAYYGFINLACASSETHNLQRVFLHIQDSKGGHCAREWESLRDRSHACFNEERLSKIKFRAFRRRVGPRIL